MPLFWCLFAGAAAAYCFAIRECGEAPLRMLFLGGVLFRLIMLGGEPSLSEDVYRYVWDGRVQQAGINPYLHAPNDEALASLRDESVYPRVNHTDVPTIYPPAAQLLFRVAQAVSPTVLSVRILVVVFDLLGAWFLLGLLRRFSQPPGQVLIYLWNPLLVVEGAGSGHIDVVAISFMVMALLYLHVDGHGRSAALLALSFLTKLFPVSLLPVLWRWSAWAHLPEPTWKTRAAALVNLKLTWPVLVFVGIAALGFWMFGDAGWAMVAGLQTYATHWEFNAPVFDGLRWMLGDGDSARKAIGMSFAAVVVVVTFARRIPPVQAGYYLAGAFLVLTPTLHPWYALWMLPFLVFYRRPAWLAFTLLAPVSYHVLIRYHASGVWEEAMWPRWVLFGGSALVWMVDGYLARRHAHGEEESGPASVVPVNGSA